VYTDPSCLKFDMFHHRKAPAMKPVPGLTTHMDGSITLNGASVEGMDASTVIERLFGIRDIRETVYLTGIL
jgi:hypothetical protein